MNYLRKIAILSLMGAAFVACKNDDDTPTPVNEEEVITTMTITLQPIGGGTAVILQTRDLDGDGPNAPVVTVSGNLTEGATYNGSIVLLNETETPAEDITEEVEDEAEEHQFFFIIGGGLDATVDYDNFDGNGDPLGTEFTLTANTASSGTMNVVLRHEPNKPNDGTLGDAGGETDIAEEFDLTIE